MANLAETSTYDAGVYQLEVTDPATAGASGILNTPFKNLTNRTNYLKAQVDSLKAGSAATGGTGQTVYTVGDMLYASTTTALAKLAGVAVGNVLRAGGVGVAPAWGKVALTTDVSGTLPVANGGTGVTTSTGSGNVVLSTSPVLVTPALGTPASGNLANCTFPTLNQSTTGAAANITGVAAVANGGTGSASGSLVSVISANTTAAAGTTYVLTANLTLTLPASPVAGNTVSVSNVSGVTTCVVARNAQNIMSLAQDMTLNTAASFKLVFADATRGWVVL